MGVSRGRGLYVGDPGGGGPGRSPADLGSVSPRGWGSGAALSQPRGWGPEAVQPIPEQDLWMSGQPLSQPPGVGVRGQLLVSPGVGSGGQPLTQPLTQTDDSLQSGNGCRSTKVLTATDNIPFTKRRRSNA